jgi:predicted transglutaminase-like cysteine proteinase
MMRHAFIISFLSLLPLGAKAAEPYSKAAEPYSKAIEPYLQAGYLSTTPRGWVQFCSIEPQECAGAQQLTAPMPASPQMYAALNHVNRAVNREIKEVSDLENYGVDEYWSYPKNGKGDCEDFVLEKKRRLVLMGFPKSVLLITIVRDRKNEGHSVLTVRTTKGDLILDNQAQKIKIWHETGYTFLKRQSEENPNNWLALSTGSTPLVASLRK